jgi:hypothetical protein
MNHRDARLQFALLSFVRGSTALPQMRELLPDLFDRQDAPDAAAVTGPFLWIVRCGRGVRVVPLATVVCSPFLRAMPVVSHAFRCR